MSWNNQGGPWGGGGGGGGQGGGQSPWSRGPGGGGQPPDFEEMLRRGQDRMKNLVPGGMGPGKVGVLIAGVAILLLAGFLITAAIAVNRRLVPTIHDTPLDRRTSLVLVGGLFVLATLSSLNSLPSQLYSYNTARINLGVVPAKGFRSSSAVTGGDPFNRR